MNGNVPPAKATLVDLLRERNRRETEPVVDIIAAFCELQNENDALQERCLQAERKLVERKGEDRVTEQPDPSELDKLEVDKLKSDLAEAKEQAAKNDREREVLQKDKEKAEAALERLVEMTESAVTDKELTEKQFEGLKSTIRSLQEEAKSLTKDKTALEERIVTEKTKMVNEMNQLTELVSSLKREVDMLRKFRQRDEERSKGWLVSDKSKLADKKSKGATSSSAVSLGGTRPQKETSPASGQNGTTNGHRASVVLPTTPSHTVNAHPGSEGTCLRYGKSSGHLDTSTFVTAGTDGTVKVWDENATLRATLQGSVGQAMTSCDLYDNFCVGAASDKTCRVWDIRTQRMLHHLVGHQHKITAVRFSGDGAKAVITASADRTIKVWDITRRTYRQASTLRHSSTCHCIDVGADPSVLVSGHDNGTVRFWDLRATSHTSEFTDVHPAAIASVHLNPANNHQVLTNGLDSSLRLIDARKTDQVVRSWSTLRHGDFTTTHSWSRAVWSPDGKYAAAGSNGNGLVMIWKVSDGVLVSKLTGHVHGVCGIDWSRSGSASGKQVATVDRKGKLIVWS